MAATRLHVPVSRHHLHRQMSSQTMLSKMKPNPLMPQPRSRPKHVRVSALFGLWANDTKLIVDQVSEVSRKLSQLDSQFSALDSSVKLQFSALDSSVKLLSTQFSALDSSVKLLSTQVVSLDQKLEKVDERVRTLGNDNAFNRATIISAVGVMEKVDERVRTLGNDNAFNRATIISAVGVNVGAFVAPVLALIYFLSTNGLINKSS